MKGLLFTYAMTYGGAVISLFNPFYGLLIYICFAIVKPPALWHWSVPAGNYSRIIAIAFLLGWAMNGFGDRSVGKANGILRAVLSYFFWVIIATVFSSRPELGMGLIEDLSKILLPFVAGITLVRTWKQLEQLIWVIIGSCAYLAFECNLAYLQGYSIEINGFLGTDNNTFASFVVTAFGMTLVRALEDPVAWRRWCTSALAAAIAHVPMCAFSRGGMLGVGVAAMAASIIVPKDPRIWRYIIAGVIAASILAGPSVVSEFQSSYEVDESGEMEGSAQSRIDLWKDCTDVALKNPVVGIGPRCWVAIAHTYGWPHGKAAHSLWFQAAAELGFPGLALLAYFYVKTVWACWGLRHSSDPRLQSVGRMVVASLLGFGVCATFLSLEGLEVPYYVALVGASALKMNGRLAERVDDEEDEIEGMEEPN